VNWARWIGHWASGPNEGRDQSCCAFVRMKAMFANPGKIAPAIAGLDTSHCTKHCRTDIVVCFKLLPPGAVDIQLHDLLLHLPKNLFHSARRRPLPAYRAQPWVSTSSSIGLKLAQGQLKGGTKLGCLGQFPLTVGFPAFQLSGCPCPARNPCLGAVAFFLILLLWLEAWLVAGLKAELWLTA